MCVGSLYMWSCNDQLFLLEAAERDSQSGARSYLQLELINLASTVSLDAKRRRERTSTKRGIIMGVAS